MRVKIREIFSASSELYKQHNKHSSLCPISVCDVTNPTANVFCHQHSADLCVLTCSPNPKQFLDYLRDYLIAHGDGYCKSFWEIIKLIS